MLTEVSISNFKSIKKIEKLELKPLTILTGVNSSGKSNIMEAISLFGEASRPIRRGGPPPDIKTVLASSDVKKYPQPIEDFIVYKKGTKKKVVLEINLKPDKFLIDDIDNLLTVNDEIRKHVFPDATVTEIKWVTYSYSFRLSDSFFAQKILVNGAPLIEVRQQIGQSPHIIYPKNLHGVRIQHTLGSILVENVFSSTQDQALLNSILSIARRIVLYVKKRAKGFYLISGERGKIDSEITISRIRPEQIVPSWIGYNGQHLIEILSRCFTRESEKTERIRKWANKFQLPEIRAGYVGKGKLESNFKDSILNINLNSTLAGLGSRQILSIIVQIFWSEYGDVIMIEEPEISLHPENQVLLQELFSEAISQGIQIICSTHSPFFVLALSKVIKKKLLTLDQIAVYHVQKSKEGTYIEPLKLNKHGFIVSGIPSFMKVEEDLFRDWSESLEEE